MDGERAKTLRRLHQVNLCFINIHLSIFFLAVQNVALNIYDIEIMENVVTFKKNGVCHRLFFSLF